MKPPEKLHERIYKENNIFKGDFLMKRVFCRCGADNSAEGCPEFWLEGRYYGCVMPEEIIDAELLVASEKTMNMEEIKNEKQTKL